MSSYVQVRLIPQSQHHTLQEVLDRIGSVRMRAFKGAKHMKPSLRRSGIMLAVLMAGTALSAGEPWAQNATGPAITVNAQAGRHLISPYIYGMAAYGVGSGFRANARLPVMRWGGDGTTRYNWEVDSSNAGFDWYFMGGDGNANPVPGRAPEAPTVFTHLISRQD